MLTHLRCIALLLPALSAALLIPTAQADVLTPSTTSSSTMPNEVLPEGSIRAPVDDAAIVQQVQRSFQHDPQLASEKIGVVCEQGVVTLSGSVSSDERITRAARYVLAVPGVKLIQNQLTALP